MGVYGGKKYQGLGSRDVSIFIHSNFQPFAENKAKVTTRACNKNYVKDDSYKNKNINPKKLASSAVISDICYLVPFSFSNFTSRS